MKISPFVLSLFLGLLISCSSEETQVTYALSITASPAEGGVININPSVSAFNEGERVTITAQPNPNWVFQQWEGDATGSSNPLQLSMTSSKSVIGRFVRREYPLTLTVTGEGTVQEKVISNAAGKDYSFGTLVELTPVPAEGWEFESWGGDLSGTDFPKTITVDGQKSVTITFVLKQTLDFYNTSRLRFDQAYAELLPNLPATFYGPPANFHYSMSGVDYFLFPGTTPTAGLPAPGITLKKEDDSWVLHEIYYDALMNQPRNFKILDADEFVLGDSNEHGPSPWRGNLWYGKIQGDGGIDWTRINSDEDKAFYHGVTGGDLNKDGLWDFGGVPFDPEYKIFIQEPAGTYTKMNEIWAGDFLENETFGVPFTINFADVFGDERDEIITADYGGGDVTQNPFLNNITIYAFNELSQKFELHFRSSEPDIFPLGLGATSIIVEDFNLDGNQDIAVAREEGIGTPYNSIEVWLGNGDGTFYSSFSKLWEHKELQFREFAVLDANQDGYPDIVLRTNNGTDFWTGDLNNEGEPYQDGISLNQSILINNGSGSFEAYNDRELIFKQSDGYPSVPHNLNPYIKEGRLCFLGARNLNDPGNDGYFDVDIIEICVDLR